MKISISIVTSMTLNKINVSPTINFTGRYYLTYYLTQDRKNNKTHFSKTVKPMLGYKLSS